MYSIRRCTKSIIVGVAKAMAYKQNITVLCNRLENKIKLFLRGKENSNGGRLQQIGNGKKKT